MARGWAREVGVSAYRDSFCPQRRKSSGHGWRGVHTPTGLLNRTLKTPETADFTPCVLDCDQNAAASGEARARTGTWLSALMGCRPPDVLERPLRAGGRGPAGPPPHTKHQRLNAQHQAQHSSSGPWRATEHTPDRPLRQPEGDPTSWPRTPWSERIRTNARTQDRAAPGPGYKVTSFPYVEVNVFLTDSPSPAFPAWDPRSAAPIGNWSHRIKRLSHARVIWDHRESGAAFPFTLTGPRDLGKCPPSSCTDAQK